MHLSLTRFACDTRRRALFAMLLFVALCAPSLAYAQTSAYCPTPIAATVVNGGSVSIDVSNCDGPFDGGMSEPLAGTGASNGTVLIGPNSGNVQFVSYTHDGTATTSDQFFLEDNDLGLVQFDITVTGSGGAITIAPATLPAMQVGVPFSQVLTASGGMPPYFFVVNGGQLPPGLVLQNDGTLTGTPTRRGNYSFGVYVDDMMFDSGTQSYAGIVANPTLTMTPTSGTAANAVPFTQTLSTTGGIAPYSYSVDSGTLPAGITLSATGTISGTSTAAGGDYPVVVRVTDSSTGPAPYFELENYTLTLLAPPVVTIAVAPANVDENGTANLTYTVTRTPATFAAMTVNLAWSGSATSGTDYTGQVASVTIPANATTATVIIDPTGDANIESDETVIAQVTPGAGYTVGGAATATGNIVNDDVPTATIAVSPASVTEDGAPNLVYTVTLSSNPGVTSYSIDFTASGTATSGVDYATVTSPLVIPAGVLTGTITVNPTADATIEANETVAVTLNAGAGYMVGSPSSATGTILNDDLPTLSINDVSLAEGNAGTTSATFTVSLSSPAGPGGVTFDIATANGTATAGSDYVANSLTGQTIPAGSSSYAFIVLLNGDALNEPSETFFANVTNVTGAVVVDGQGVGTIANDDPLPSLAMVSRNIVERNAMTQSEALQVTLSAPSGQTVTANWATANGTATAGSDYVAAGGTVTFAPGQTTQAIGVGVTGDIVPEANETFTVTLTAPVNATLGTATGTYTIVNDDVPVTISPATLPNGAVAAPYSQTLTASGGVAPYDFTVTLGSLPPGLTLSSGGVLSGTPTAGGSFNFTVTATDSSPFPGPFSSSQSYTLVIAPPTVVLPATALPDATLGMAYPDTNITPASGGTAPYTYAVTAGALPPGMSLQGALTGAIVGTPTALGTYNFSITATDSSTGTGPYTATQNYGITVLDVPPVANDSSLTVAYNAAATNVPLLIGGGAPTSVDVVTAPVNGTAIASGTTISYQPNTGFAGSDSFTYTATNSGGTSATAMVTVTVSAPVVTVTASGGFSATVGVPYSQTFTWNGGAQPWSGYQVTGLPAGLALTGTTGNAVTVSGTPTQAGTFGLMAIATDSSSGDGPFTINQAFVLSVSGPTLALAPTGTTFTAAYAAAYSQAFTATGGVGPYTYAQTGTLPPGVSFSGNTVAGTPTVPGSYSFTVTATDTGSTGSGAPFTVAENYTIDVAAPVIVITPATLPPVDTTVAYSQNLAASGGVAPYFFMVTAGSLPAGLNLAADGTLSGNVTQVGTFNFTLTATDPNGQSGSRAYTLVVNAPTLTLAPAAGTLTAPYGAAYTQAFVAGGSPGPYSYALTGALPAGLSFSNGTISGTPTAPGSYPITVTATDTTLTGAGAPFSIAQNHVLNVPAPTVAVNPATLPDPVAGVAYSQNVIATGAVAPYGFAITAGALPSGITLGAGGALTGTSFEVGTFNFTVTATDANGQTGSRAYTVTIAAPALTMTPASGTLTLAYAAPYSQAFTAGGSPGPYSYSLTGALPAGMSFNGNTLSGTPTVPGSYPVTVTATDTVLTGAGAPFSITQTYTLDVPAPTLVLDPATLPDTTAGVAYSQQFSASGGAAPYAFAVTAGSLPNGLSLTATGALSGTTTASGTFNFTVTATDAFGLGIAGAYTVTVAVPTLALTPATLPAGTAGTAYSQVLTISGGIAPYTVTQSGALPAGLTFNAATRTFSGTPTQSGTFAISVTVTDSTGGTAATVTNNYTLVIAAPTLSLAPAALPGATAGVAYNQAFVASGGIAPYTYAVSAGALPAGLALNAGTGALAGTPTAAGTFNFSVTARDSTTGTAATVTRAYTLTVSAPSITVNPPTLPGGTVGVPYTHVLNAVGGTAPYTFAVTAGALPGGLTLASDGRISGEPVAGSFAFTVTATDALGFTGARAYTVTVVERPDPSRDPEVRGLIQAQAESARRFASGQVTNFQNRMETLHDNREGARLSNRLSFVTSQQCTDYMGRKPGDPCTQLVASTGAVAGAGAGMEADAAAPGDGGSAQGAAGPFSTWIGGMIRSGNQDGRGGGAGIDFETDGISVGADYRFSPAFVLGAGLGYGRDDSDVGDNGSRVEGDAQAVVVYGSFHPGDRYFLDALVGYQRLSYDLRRFVTGTGGLVEGSRDGRQWFGSVSAGAQFQHDTWQLTPYARADVSKATLDGYVEHGDPVFSLVHGEQDVDSTTGNLGLRVESRATRSWGAFAPQLRLEYQHDFNGDSSATMQYADLLTGPLYRAAVTGFDRSRVMVGLGAMFYLPRDLSMRVEYRGLFGNDGDRDNGFMLNIEKSY